jgi:hypothetical protein
MLLADTVRALGWLSVARVAWYRLLVRAGWHPVQRLTGTLPSGPFFSPVRLSSHPAPAPQFWQDEVRAFGWHSWPVGTSPPAWRRNLFTGVETPLLPWWRIPDFSAADGDIKGVWELSRFDWVLAFAQRTRTGDASALAQLEYWLADWCRENPAYYGPNWKCGQEASIRVLRLALAAAFLEQDAQPLPSLQALVRLHLRRIAPTITYALGQDNNHGTSEAAALFIGGTWLLSLGDPDGAVWASTGARWLEERALMLIQEDGSFSQHSVTYHRLMLETYTVSEWWRRRWGHAELSWAARSRLVSATRWLASLIDPVTGDAPNLGANDGAHLLPLSEAATRDFRPAVRAASIAFADADIFAEVPQTLTHIRWLGFKPADRQLNVPEIDAGSDGGFLRMRLGTTLVVLRVPRFPYRPAHADPLHVDLWVAGENVLRDGGSFSYSDFGRGSSYYPGIASHNTVQIDAYEPMPRLGTFLWGRWLKPIESIAPILDRDTLVAVAAYRDARGASHRRTLRLRDRNLCVHDKVRGIHRSAVLRWRLSPGAWRFDGDIVTDGVRRVHVTSDVRITRRALVEGWESRHYLHESSLPVLEVEVAGDAKFRTEVDWV